MRTVRRPFANAWWVLFGAEFEWTSAAAAMPSRRKNPCGPDPSRQSRCRRDAEIRSRPDLLLEDNIEDGHCYPYSGGMDFKSVIEASKSDHRSHQAEADLKNFFDGAKLWDLLTALSAWKTASTLRPRPSSATSQVRRSQLGGGLRHEGQRKLRSA